MLNNIPIGITKMLKKGDELIFRQIPIKGSSPTDIYYYERMTDITVVTPNNESILLNSLGTVGEPPMMYFAFKQEENHDIYYYGNIYYEDPSKPKTIKGEEWIIDPSCGKCLNYPGSYSLGVEWDYKFKLLKLNGEEVSVNLHHKVIEYTKISIGMGEFWTYKINAYTQNGEIDSESWFSPQLGVNVKRISYSEIKPGYELVEYNVKGS